MWSVDKKGHSPAELDISHTVKQKKKHWGLSPLISWKERWMHHAVCTPGETPDFLELCVCSSVRAVSLEGEQGVPETGREGRIRRKVSLGESEAQVEGI